MADPVDLSPDERARVGLCTSCRHGRRIVSAKGSAFWLCERARVDPAFQKYPRLPVLRCAGHEAVTRE